MVPQKPQVRSSCKAHDAMEWQRHFERHATPQMGRNCGFWVHLRMLRLFVFRCEMEDEKRSPCRSVQECLAARAWYAP
jgi:hypothetical protein